MKTKLSILFTFVVLAALVSGCGGDGAGYPSQSELDSLTPTGATAEAKEEKKESSGKAGKPPKVSDNVGEKPTIADPSGDPPTELVTKDIVKGDGKTAKTGDEVSVNYVGLNWDDASEFDTSFGKDPFSFTLGEGGVIKGWDEGVVGMKEGGRRLLIIPPDLGYGESGQGASIPPNSTLVFVVDLEGVK